MRALAVIRPGRRLPSASQLARAFNCGASEHLPHVASTNEHSARGTAAHAFMVRAREVGRDVALAEAEALEDEHLALYDAIPLDELPAGGQREVALAWDHVADTTRVIGGAGHRDYAAVGATEYPGTYDYVGQGPGVAIVIDWKFGRKWLGPAAKSWQLRLGALAAARLIGADSARVAYFYLRDDGTYGVSWATFDAFDLAEIAAELRALAARLDAPGGAAHEGEWCDYCPAFDACPSKLALARQIGEGTALAEVEARISAMTRDELAAAYLAIERYDVIAERARKAIRQRSEMQPVDLGDGNELGPVKWPFTTVNATCAHDEITKRHGAAVADEACPRKATITAIRKLGKETVKAIENRGGIYTGTTVQVRVHKKEETK